MLEPKLWRAGVAGLLALAWVGCAKTRSHDEPESPDELEDGGSAADTDAAVQEAGNAPDAIADGGDPRLACPVTRQLDEALAVSCPGTAAFGTPCADAGAQCVSYEEMDGSLYACNSRCSSTKTWDVTCVSECKNACEAPPDAAAVIELDVSDCGRRELIDCNDGAITLQAQLNSQVGAMLLPNIDLVREIQDDTLVVQFENGCPARVYATSGQALEALDEAARSVLDVRISCALALECGQFIGPSTVAAP